MDQTERPKTADARIEELIAAWIAGHPGDPKPSREHAATEIAEALDAWLRKNGYRLPDLF